jgi:hypothetical protein
MVSYNIRECKDELLIIAIRLMHDGCNNYKMTEAAVGNTKTRKMRKPRIGRMKIIISELSIGV